MICLYFVLIKCIFNSRSPHGERFSFFASPRPGTFQFSLPAWGATYFQFIAHYCHHISILASCLGSDKSAMLHRRSFAVFNSRSPHGERHDARASLYTICRFQFTLPAWGATYNGLAGGCLPPLFNSRSPHGERRF